MSLWRKWCKKVEKHNQKQDYVTQEECWSPYDIFYPLLVTVLALLCTFTGTHDILFGICLSISLGVIIAIALYVNWKIYD